MTDQQTMKQKLSFVSLCIDRAAKKIGCAEEEMYSRLKQHNLIEGYLLEYYDTLHTQSIEYAVDDLLQALYHREGKE